MLKKLSDHQTLRQIAGR